MASVRSIHASFPETLRKALDLRSQETSCPAEVLTRLQYIPFFQASRVNPAPTTRFQSIAGTGGHLKSSSVSHTPAHPVHHGAGRADPVPRRFHGAPPVSQWRPLNDRREGSGQSNRSQGSRDKVLSGDLRSSHADGPYRASSSGFKSVGNTRSEPRSEPRPDRSYSHDAEIREGMLVHTDLRSPSPNAEDSPKNVLSDTVILTTDVPTTSTKFSSAAVKSSVDTDDRILAKVKGKINKIGFTTYDATKTFMQQILDSEETEFLDEFMKFVFQKAATESTFCPLYAKLLHELADQFTHLRVVMHNLFRDYTAIFTEVETAPDVGTEDYKAFVEAQERKKFRRGYSQFVAELVKLGEADEEAFAILVQQIVAVLEASNASPAKTLVCEEYIDCLAHMCTSAPKILSRSSWAPGVKDRLIALTELPRSTTLGLTNKGRFALMDLVDFAKRGWK